MKRPYSKYNLGDHPIIFTQKNTKCAFVSYQKKIRRGDKWETIQVNDYIALTSTIRYPRNPDFTVGRLDDHKSSPAIRKYLKEVGKKAGLSFNSPKKRMF